MRTSLALLLVIAGVPAFAGERMPISQAAEKMLLQRHHNAGCGIPIDTLFKSQLDFTGAATYSPQRPWEDIDFKSSPQKYMQVVLDAAIDENEAAGWDIGNRKTNGWVHAPWMAKHREPYNGLTFERRSRPFELHALQGEFRHNYAVGLYNAIAARAFKKMWADPARPVTKDFAMEPGSVAVKFLFTTATPAEVSYLSGSWEVDVCDDNTRTTARLLQVDIAVRDPGANDLTGWVFGTFIYHSFTAEKFDWENVRPFTLQWGNDEEVWPTGLSGYPVTPADLPALSESWYDPRLRGQFWASRRGHGLAPYTGLFGRAGGPVDNPRSSCLSCHALAADFGRGSDEKPHMAPARGWVEDVVYGGKPGDRLKDYFKNRKSNEPKLKDTLALDYSLQAMVGVLNFRGWVTCRGDHVEADIDPYPGKKPRTLSLKDEQEKDRCEAFLNRTGDVLERDDADHLAGGGDDTGGLPEGAPAILAIEDLSDITPDFEVIGGELEPVAERLSARE